MNPLARIDGLWHWLKQTEWPAPLASDLALLAALGVLDDVLGNW